MLLTAGELQAQDVLARVNFVMDQQAALEGDVKWTKDTLIKGDKGRLSMQEAWEHEGSAAGTGCSRTIACLQKTILWFVPALAVAYLSPL